MKNLVFLFVLFVVFFNFSNAQTPPKPNIILIIADDQGWSQVSNGRTNLNNGSDFYETPVLDRLATEGIAFPHGYSNGANCAPTRAAILSGQYAVRPTNNVFNVGSLDRRGGKTTTLCAQSMGILIEDGNYRKDQIPSEAITIAETLKTAGYTTAHFGKYHAGGEIEANKPENQGFDYNYGGNSSGSPGNYFAKDNNGSWEFVSNVGPELDPFAQPYTEAQSQELAGDSSLTGTAKHVTDAMTEAALDFITNNTNGAPFFMHFSQYAIHGPYSNANARPDLLSKYQTKKSTSPSQMGHDHVGQGAILTGMDQAIGRLINYLENTDDPRNAGHKLADNTLVYYVSDNGGTVSTDDNGPLKGKKGEFNEGGIRSVTLAWSPGLVANPGSIVNTPILTFDTYPTFAELAGASLPNPNDYPIDGVSILPIINGTDVNMDRGSLFWHFPGYLLERGRNARPESLIRKGDYKLRFTYEDRKYRLYNITNDMSETNDLIDVANNPTEEHIQLAIDLSTELIAFLVDTNAKLPFEKDSGGSCTTTEVSLPEIYSEPDPSPPAPDAEATLIAHYDFNGNYNSSGGTYTDNLTATSGANTISFVNDNNGIAASAVDISGTATDSGIEGTNNFPISGSSERTITAWIKVPTGNSTRVITELGNHNGGDGKRFSLTILSDNRLSLGIRGGSISTSAEDTVPEGTWIFVATTYTGPTSNTVNIYISPAGTPIIAADASGPLAIDTETAVLKVAKGTQGGSRTFYGSIADLRVYEGALSISQLNQIKGGATLGTNDVSIKKNEIVTFPTIVEDYLTIKTSLSGQPHITIYDLTGKTVKKAFSKKIDMRNLSKGLYIINVRVGNKVGKLKVLKK